MKVQQRRLSFLKQLKLHHIWLLAVLIVNPVLLHGQNYCVPTVVNQANYNLGIANVSLGSISNNTGTPNPNNYYVDYSQTHITTANPGAFINYTLTAGNSNNTRFSIFVDWNQDGTFGVGNSEQVMLSGTINPNQSTSGSFQVPVSQTAGVYRIRIVGDLGSQTINPCVLNYTGDIEDYTLIVTSPAVDIVGVSSPTVPSLGNAAVELKVANISNGTVINTYEIGYRLDNGTPVTENLNTQNLAPASLRDHTFGTLLNITTPGTYTLKVWARNPNGLGSGTASNDTVYKTFKLCYPISGNFTINPNGVGPNNFTSFTDAVNQIVDCGINGPVHFAVAAGTYNEQITIPFINGSSATNTVTFDGGAGNYLTRVLSFNTVDINNRHVVRIDGAAYVSFRNLSIRSTGASYGWPVHIKANSQHVTFARNLIQSADYNTSTGSTNFIPVCISGSNTSYSSPASNTNNVRIDSNIIQGGYFNFTMWGGGTSTNNYDIWVRRNIHEAFYYYGLYAVNLSNIHIQWNQFTQRATTTTGGYGISLSSINSSGNLITEIEGNDIRRSHQYGIYLSSVNNNGQRGKLINNMAGAGAVSTAAITCYMTSSSNFDVWHNTFVNPSATTGTNNAALYINSSNNASVLNNIFNPSSVGSSAYAVYATSTTQFAAFDYNNFYKEGSDVSTPLIWMNNVLLNAKSLVGASGFNVNSISESPLFISNTNYRLSANGQSPFGSGNLGLTEDIDGDVRCTLFPSIGADESPFSVANQPNIIMPDTVYVNSPTPIYNSASAGEAKNHVWTINGGAAVFNSVHVNYTFNLVGLYDVKLSTESCSGTDTAYKQVVAVVPTQAPVSAFLADQNEADQGYPVQFTDQSTGGPSSWVWSITPATGVQFLGSSNDQNPSVVFNQVGEYEVCLIASNIAGQGNQLCRTAYIRVGEANNMCDQKTVSKSPTGKIFDTGGRNGDYANGSNCGFLIDPCASSVTLRFSAFNLDAGDYLRVFDGADDMGTPLYTGAGFTGSIVPTDLTASTGKMYLQFISNGSGTLSGFEAAWTSTAKNFAAPVAAFRAPDTLYVGTTFTFLSNSTGIDPELRWDFDNDGNIDATGRTASHTFTTIGTQLVRLTIEDCGGLDGAVKAITVIAPTAAPSPDFVSDFRTITSGQTVRFYDRSTQAPDSWEWIFAPNKVTFMEGTDMYSQNPVVRFDSVASYDVTLNASNSFGTGTITKNAAIRSVQYCYPGAGLNTDLGITRVTFAGIDQVSLVGPATYSDYSLSVAPAAVQKGSRYPIIIERATANEDMSRKVWIDFNGDGVFGPTEEVASHTADKSLMWMDSITIPVSAQEGSTRMRIGTSYGITNNSACGVNPYGEFEDYTINIYENLTRPVITLNGSSVVSIEVGSNYNDSGATAMDDVDGNLSAFIITTTNLNTQVVGTYYVRYNVSDNNGNSAEVERTVYVTPDITPPVVTLNGTTPMAVVVGTQFIDPGVNAIDSYDGVIPASGIQVFGTVNSLQLGQYTLTYTATDQAGNMASVVRIVNVGDTTVPQLYLKGADTIVIALGQTFVDPGIVVLDNNSSNLPFNVDYTVIDNSVVGDYTLTYTAVDSSGNVAVPVYRVVAVRDLTAPVLSLVGDTVIIEVHTAFVDPGYHVSDNYDQTVPVNVNGAVDTAKTGLYVLFYQATDQGGNNSALLYRIVQVRDTKAPVISLNGDKFVTLCRWESYTDPGYTVSDNYDLTIEVEVESSLKVETEGLYSIRYTARDKAGNVAIAAERLIRVIACVNGVAQASENQIEVYPNPGRGVFTVRLNDVATPSEVKISDLTGKILDIAVQPSTEGAQFDMTQLPAGTYMVMVNTSTGLITKRIQVIH
ncbi:MAG: DUF5011 domain-containing protein [Bacteroidetes bacterium]|nr:MAG: DUF5011 domain-containing protein [Bacteroidota bacterium]